MNGVVTHYALDAQTDAPFPAQWWGDTADPTVPLQQIIVPVNQLPSGINPVTGTITSPTQGLSFSPTPGRPFNVWAWGTFVATLVLERSFDGANWFTVDPNISQKAARTYSEPEADIVYRLNCVSFTSGTISYRMST